MSESKPAKKVASKKTDTTPAVDTKAQTENTEARTGYLSFRERVARRRRREAR